MIVLINRELYRYEIHSLVKAFYPEEDVKVLVGETSGDSAPFMELIFEPQSITAVIPDSGLTETAQAQEGECFDSKGPASKAAMKHLLYRILTRYTGRELPWGELIGIRPTKLATGLLGEGVPDEGIAAHLKEALPCDGFNILQNNGAAAGQTVMHLHFHIVPRYGQEEISFVSHTGDMKALKALAEQLRF